MSCPLTADSISAFVIGCPFTTAIVSAANAGMETRTKNRIDRGLNRVSPLHALLIGRALISQAERRIAAVAGAARLRALGAVVAARRAAGREIVPAVTHVVGETPATDAATLFVFSSARALIDAVAHSGHIR